MSRLDSVSEIKRARKESNIRREISAAVLSISKDHKELGDLVVSRVQLSKGKNQCSIYFYTSEGEEKFMEKLELLKLYKPSIRTMLAKNLQSRYVPEIRFKFDKQLDKTSKMEQVIESLDLGDKE